MTDKINLASAGSGYNLAIINDNFTKVEDALNNRVLYRDTQTGEVNSLLSDLDANGQRIYNLPVPADLSEAARLADVQSAIAGDTAANLITADDNASGVNFTTVQGFINEVQSVDGAKQVGYGSGTVNDALNALSNATVLVGTPSVGDSASLFQTAINTVVFTLGGRGTVICNPGAEYSVTSTIYVPAGVIIDLNGSRLTGSGIGGNTIFESGYVVGSNVVSNLAAGNEVGRVIDTTIKNGRIQNCGIAFDLKNFNENSLLENIEFSNCSRAIRSLRPFYSSYRNLMSRNSAGGSTLPAYHFSTFVNAILIDSVFVVNRVLGWQFDGGCYAVSITGNSGAESCTNGFLFQGTVHGLTLTNLYFEFITGNAFEFSGGGSSFFGVDIDNCWFNSVETCINAINFTGKWSRGNRRNTGNCYVNFASSTNTAEIELDHSYDATNLIPSTPSWLTYGPRCVINQKQTLYNTGSGLPTVRADNPGERPTPLYYFGDSGDPDTNNVAFATSVSSSPGSTPFDVYVNTNITYRSYSLVAYKLRITDNVGSYDVYGIVYGGTAVKADATAKTVTASNNGGKLRLAFSSFSHPSGTFSCTGVVRHM